MTLVQAAYAVSSALNAVASAEVAYRYLRWWPQVRGGSILAELILGIGVAQTALTIITTVRAVQEVSHPDGGMVTVESSIITLALAMLLAGTYLHLLPAWQLREGYGRRHPALAIVWRSGLVLSGVLWLMWRFA